VFTDPECGTTYFCSGKDLATDSQTAYNACKEEENETRCKSALGEWKTNGSNGMFALNGCTSVWKCGQSIYMTQADYDKDCGCELIQETYISDYTTGQGIIEYQTKSDPFCGCKTTGRGGSCVEYNICQVPIYGTIQKPVYSIRNVCKK